MRILFALLGLNALSFIVTRMVWWIRDDLSAKIVIPRKKLRTEDDNKIIFLSAGNLAQPKKAFQFLKPILRREQCAFLEFKMIGWSPRSTTKAIVEEITSSGCEATLWTISVGDHVGRYLGTYSCRKFPMQTYAINPCPERKALRHGLGGLLMIVAPILWTLAHLLGWLSIIPIIPATGGKYSLILLADQYMVVAYDTPEKNTARTHGVILSSQDELLDNNFLEKYFKNTKIVYVSTHHGDTVGMANRYLRGAELLKEL